MSQGERGAVLRDVLAGVGVGALVGAAAALLLAPQGGQATRTQIRGTADDLLVKMRDTVEEMRGKVDEMVVSLKSRTESSAGREPGPAALPGGEAGDAPPAGV